MPSTSADSFSPLGGKVLLKLRYACITNDRFKSSITLIRVHTKFPNYSIPSQY